MTVVILSETKDLKKRLKTGSSLTLRMTERGNRMTEKGNRMTKRRKIRNDENDKKYTTCHIY